MENYYTGKRLDGRYEIQEVIGVGGMAIVYRAYDNIDDRVVAVKILKDEFLANEEFRRRFKNESKAIAVLSHPNIVKVYDVSYGDRLQYIVMEYVEGITLKEYIEQQGKINWREAVHFMMQILRALQHAHDKGIVHRDVKPQNIMLLQNGNIKVTDFGIARFSRSDTRTMTDSAIGSVHYISPEQARGDLTDDKADIYSVGVVLYEMLTGQVPFQSNNTVSVAIMQLQSDPVMPRQINANIPAGLEQITMHAMQKNAKDRFQSAAEMLLDLEEVKRNPAITFDYSFFVDKTPTKFVRGSTGDIPAPVAPPSPAADPVDVNSGEEYEYDDEDYAQENAKTKTVPILIGITGALIALCLIVVGVLALTKPGKGEMIEVANFLNQNYDELIQKDEYKDKFKFEEMPSSRSNVADGTIISQEPPAGTKVKIGSLIKLSVVRLTAPGDVVMPDVIGDSRRNAQTKVEQLGLAINWLPQISTDPEDTIVKTVPEDGAKLKKGDTVDLYYATPRGQVEMPNLVGWSLDTARSTLENETLGLVLDMESSKAVKSTKPKNEVISQSIAEKQLVTRGTKVSVTYSNGILPESTARGITVALPDKNNQEGKLSIYLDNVVYGTPTTVLCNGNQNYQLPDIIGTKENSEIRILVDGQQIFSCNANFTKDPAVLSNVDKQHKEIVTQAPTSPSEFLPLVVGLSYEAAVDKLNKKGFMNIRRQETTVTLTLEVGMVQSQVPSAISLQRIPTDQQITLFVGVLKPDETTTEEPSSEEPTTPPEETTEPPTDAPV